MVTPAYRSGRQRDLRLYARGLIPMLISESYRRCIGFITSDEEIDRDRKERIPVGTVFFLSMPFNLAARESGGFTTYAVTTKHTIIGHDSDEIVIRTNMRDCPSYRDIDTKRDEWILHPTTDVAVCILRASDIESFQYDFIAPYSTRAHSRCDVGDSIFSVGLFEGFHGNGLIMPLARFGKISLMPHDHEKVDVEILRGTSTPIKAYLAELTCWEGQSGSPVFLSMSEGRERIIRVTEDSPDDPFAPAIIGLIQGFYPVEYEKLNAGIAIVIPAQDIIDTLMSDELVKDREDGKQYVIGPRMRPRMAVRSFGGLVRPEDI